MYTYIYIYIIEREREMGAGARGAAGVRHGYAGVTPAVCKGARGRMMTSCLRGASRLRGRMGLGGAPGSA